MFQIRWKDTSGGAYTTLTLRPAPFDVEYPDDRDYKETKTQDGKTLVQRPLIDTRARKWIWDNFPQRLTTFWDQWQILKGLEYRTRLDANKWPYVGIFEDEMGFGGFDRTVSGSPVFTQVKILKAQLKHLKGKTLPQYDAPFIEFVVEDPTFQGF